MSTETAERTEPGSRSEAQEQTAKRAAQHRAGRKRQREQEALGVLHSAVRDDRWLNAVVRALLGVFALTALVLAARYIWVHSDSMVEVLRRPRSTAGDLGDRLVALTTPVVLLILLAALAAVAALVIHSRAMDETYRVIDSINRIRREDEVAVSARGLTHSFEEKLQNASRAFSVMLWFGRTLFIVCLGLFTLAVLQAMASGVDLVTVALGAVSIAGTLLGVATDVPKTLTTQLANVLQLQSIITGCDRQMSLLESHAFSVMNRAESADGDADYAAIDAEVRRIQREIDHVVDLAVDRIQRQVEDDDVASGRRQPSATTAA